MPKRTNPFQILITLLELSLRDSVMLTPSAELTDRITGELREVDIVIEDKTLGDTLLLGIEVRGGDSPRKATVEWVECMWGKHVSLPTDKLVLVAKGGFTKTAVKKAEALGVTTLTLGDARGIDWPAQLAAFKRMRVVSFVRPVIERITVVLPASERGSADPSQLPKSSLVDSDNIARPVAQVVEEWLSDPKIVRQIEERAFVGADTLVKAEVPLKSGVVLRMPNGATVPALAVAFSARCRKTDHSPEMLLKRYRETEVAVGSLTLMGHDFQFTVTKSLDGVVTVGTAALTRKRDDREKPSA